eukprot:COSAG04_NODE_983_length_9008_cov_3.566955_1_plen_172_part_10
MPPREGLGDAIAAQYSGNDATIVEMHRRRHSVREQRVRAVTQTLDRIDATAALAAPGDGWEALSPPETLPPPIDWASYPGLDPSADGDLSLESVRHKRQQLSSLLLLLRQHVLPRLPQHGRRRFVEFASGTGHFGLMVRCPCPCPLGAPPPPPPPPPPRPLPRPPPPPPPPP